MPLGTNYDWGNMMGGYEDALSQLYRRRQPDFADFLRNLAPHLGNFLQRRKLEQMMQQMRMGNVLGAGEGMVLPQDINMMGQAAPEMMPWDRLASLVGEEPSPFPAGPMSVSKEAQRDLPPLFARDPYNEMTRQLELQYKIARLQPEGAKELTPSQKMNQMKLGLLQKLQKGEDWTQGDMAVASRFWPDKIAAMSGLSASEKINLMKLDLLEKTGRGQEWTEDEQELAKQLKITSEEKAHFTLGQIRQPYEDIMGRPIPPSIKGRMQRIKDAERLGLATGNQATLKRAEEARLMYGYATREDELALLQAIQKKRLGITQKEVEENLKGMNYSDKYIAYLLKSANFR